MTMLIASRTVQGCGGGAITLLSETIVTDIVPLRERGTYMAIVGLGAAAGATLGPFLGGLITQHSTWLWCFYFNVPIGGVAFVALLFFLRVNYKHDASWWHRLVRVDFAGNAIFIAAIVGVLIALTWDGIGIPSTSSCRSALASSESSSSRLSSGHQDSSRAIFSAPGGCHTNVGGCSDVDIHTCGCDASGLLLLANIPPGCQALVTDAVGC